MKHLLLTPLALAAFTLAAEAQQSDAPSVETVTEPVSDRARNPDMDELPPVDEGTPDMDLPGMRTVDDADLDSDGSISDDTAPLEEGFTSEVDGGADATYEAIEGDGMSTLGVDSDTDVDATVPTPEADPTDGRWIDRDNDGYDPVVDEVEQGAETAVKATGEALSTAKDAVQDVFDGDDDADGDDPVVDEVEQGAETAAEAADEAAEEVGEALDGEPSDATAPADTTDGFLERAGEAIEDGANTFGHEVKETYEEAKEEATEMNTRGATTDDDAPDR